MFFLGTYCQYENECIVKGPCGHGSTCSPRYDGKAICSCTGGFTGNHCKTDINECEVGQGPCTRNKSTCNNTVGSYICICNHGYTGKLLDSTDSQKVKEVCLQLYMQTFTVFTMYTLYAKLFMERITSVWCFTLANTHICCFHM